jgi:PAS domain S-box-containing protein
MQHGIRYLRKKVSPNAVAMEICKVFETILIVDDEAAIRENLYSSLSAVGYRVIAAQNGEEALHHLRSANPSIVLTAVRMPGMDGIELLRAIKDESPDTEVITMTGQEDLDLAVRCLKYEATDSVTKPINDDFLGIALKRAHDRISTRATIREHVEAQQHYQQLFSEAPCYIYVVDRNLKISAANRYFENDFGPWSGSYCYEVLKQMDEPCPDCSALKTIEEGKPQESETVVTSRAGEQYNVLIRTAPIRDASGEIVQVMEMSTNITEIKKLQDRLSCLGLLIGSVSHGMKGLLTNLDGGMYKINSGLTMDNFGRVREGWDGLKLTLGLVKRMVLDLLYYAKEKDLSCETIEIADFARRVASEFEHKLEGRQIEFKFEMPDPLHEFYVDSGALSSVLMNILENALDACMQDNSKSDHQIGFSVMESKDDILFEIQDNGIGMNNETQEKLFTPCFSTKGAKGTGLGLFISKEIVLRHGGSISVESHLGQGSRFSVRLAKKRA